MVKFSFKYCDGNGNGHRRCSVKQVLGLKLYQKETQKQVLTCEICEIFESTYFEVHLRTTASVETTYFQIGAG